MHENLHIFHQKGFEKTPTYEVFEKDVQALCDFITSNRANFHSANKLGENSKSVQNLLSPLCLKLGYRDDEVIESVFGRPDFSKLLEPFGEGIIIEVERGKTLDNNMDLLDLWKCHVSKPVNCLILVVPERKPTSKQMRPISKSVVSRLKQFFEEGNYTNARGLAVVSY
ncbi:hypothetical protein COU37_01355 [Candidatus Micrarchaeota archaeon CG10_big_fil_rev_8_21_14_0_10_45_29]|nr:MAG: hypothetical protein COU37_01355 [Candidatus Micrarchaeota archaeon CG10_big_fil_rev_8_21_14_0_10_45_29]